MKIKIIRDPIHGEIRIFPLEWLIIDTPLFQRLRYISQLVGAQFVFPGCTHNRFSHSLGAMNICSMYCQKFIEQNKIDYLEYRVLRLASLLHDIAHGPFSHQFDETIYKKNNYTNGHDEFRNKVILEFLPYFIEKKITSTKNIKLKQELEKEIEAFNSSSLESLLKNLLSEIPKIYENRNSYRFGIVQGTLGADRLDFIWRDSYFSGIKGFSKGDIERIISNSYIIEGKLAYHIKAMDEIYSSLYGRFMLYKNLYFHKTARAVDLMIQKILNLYSEIIDFKEYFNNPENFILLTDDFIINLHNSIKKNNKTLENIRKIIENIKNR
ncbi:MAG: HD domain-containing protein, partial [Candidatus Calescibacterium sp.]|nr:HD domain-containing protein [Candidatus Calescibacterium sp.]MDW8133328.1 HD domain-containing protein [Candidatus Calescibacterium sp.]